MARSQGLPRGVRLRAKREISGVYRNGRYHALGVLHAKTIPTDREETRFLVSVKKAIGNAPKRNRIKRLVREAVRRHRGEFSESHDICFFLTVKPTEPVSLVAIEREVRKLIGRLSRKA